MLWHGSDARIVIPQVEQALATLLDLRSCRYDSDPPTGDSGTIAQSGDVVLAGLRWNWLPGPQIELPVQYQGCRYGKFVLAPTPGTRVSEERRIVAVALADEVGAVIAGAERQSQ